MSKHKLSIVGIFFDGYIDSWIDYIHCFEKFWPDCPYDHYIVNNVENIKDTGIFIHKCRSRCGIQ